MAWTSMHFAVGMCGGAALTLAPCLILRRGWRFVPVGMTLGGLWALLPDMPRVWREDFPSLPFAATLGSRDFELWLHSIGDLFFFHHALDAQPKEFALLGLAMIIGLYNLALLGMWKPWGQKRPIVTPKHKSANAYPSITSQSKTGAETVLECQQNDTDPVVGRIGDQRSA